MATRKAALEAAMQRSLANAADKMEKMEEMIVRQNVMIGELALRATELETKTAELEAKTAELEAKTAKEQPLHGP